MRRNIKVVSFLVGATVLGVLVFLGYKFYLEKGNNTEVGAGEVIFIKNPNSTGDIYKMNPNSNTLTNITNDAKNYLRAVWSPKGDKIAFTESTDSKWLTYTMNIDGTDKQPVKGTLPLDMVCGWSPDGKYLLLTTYRDVNQEIYCLELSTGKATNLSSNPSEDYMPVWSPDGKKIAFISNRDKQGWNSLPQLYIMDVGTGEVSKVSTNNKAAEYPMWLPNSHDLAVSIEEDSLTSVYITDVSGSKLNKVESGSFKSFAQICSANGDKILIDNVIKEGGIQKHEPVWVNLKDNTKEMLVHEVSTEASFYRTKVAYVKNIDMEIPDINDLAQNAKESIALINGTLIDGNGGVPVKDALVLIDDGVIKYAGLYDKKLVPDSYKVIDLNGEYILPGFINSHVHYGYEAYNLKEWAKQGVTTVLDLGADIRSPLFDMRDNINTHPEYSRLIIAGPMLTVPDGYPQGSKGFQVYSPEDAAKKTTDLINRGVDVIKVSLETGEAFGEQLPILSYQELQSIVEAAHSKGKRVTAHVSVMNSSNIEMAINAGVDDIAHNWITPVDESVLKKIKEKNIYLVPTQEVLQYNEIMAEENLSNYTRLGGQVALGNDYGGDPYYNEMELGMPMKEINSMMDSGMTPMQIIVAATRNSAIVCDRKESLGTIEAGKIADVLVLKSNPLESIENLKKVEMVIKDGVIIVENSK